MVTGLLVATTTTAGELFSEPQPTCAAQLIRTAESHWRAAVVPAELFGAVRMWAQQYAGLHPGASWSCALNMEFADDCGRARTIISSSLDQLLYTGTRTQYCTASFFVCRGGR